MTRIRTVVALLTTAGVLALSAVTAAPASALPVAVPCGQDVFVWCGDVRNSSNSDTSMLITYNWPSGGTRADFGRLPTPATTGTGTASANIYYLQGFSGHGLALTGLAGKLVAEAIDGDARRFDTFSRLRHRPFPGGRWLRTPALVAGMAYYRLRDML